MTCARRSIYARYILSGRQPRFDRDRGAAFGGSWRQGACQSHPRATYTLARIGTASTALRRNMSKRAFTFPGQGSQAVGMGRDLAATFPEARAVFDEVDAALGQKLSTLMFEGPEETLRLTENAQPALMAVSLAVVRVLAARGATVEKLADYVAGHSLGEYSALCAAGALGLADTARLLKLRGQAMQTAVPVGKGAMAAILGLDMAAVRSAVAEAASAGVCAVANDNAPGQVVISGEVAAVERASALAKEAGAKRALPLPVSAPFHCILMSPAAD